MWTLDEAVKLCTTLEGIAPQFGAHVALTGGVLYKGWEPRKDVDIIVYRIREIEAIDVPGFMAAVAKVGVTAGKDYGWCYKAQMGARKIDFLFPERGDHGGQEYPDEG